MKIAGAGACHSDLHLMHDFDEGTLACRGCARCRSGIENYCENQNTIGAMGGGLGLDGGMAPRMLVPHACHLVPS